MVIAYCKKEAVSSDGILEIPARIRGKKVIAIGVGACQNRDDISKLVLPEHLKEIGSWAFAYDYELADVEFPEGLEKIEADAFNSCAVSLNAPELPGVEVDQRAFYISENNN